MWGDCVLIGGEKEIEGGKQRGRDDQLTELLAAMGGDGVM